MASFTRSGPACVLEFFLPKGSLRRYAEFPYASTLGTAIRIGAREVRMGKKMGFLRFAGICPERDILRMVVPEKLADKAFGALVTQFGMNRGRAGSGRIIPSVEHRFHANDPLSSGDLAEEKEEGLRFVHNLVAITCICQRGRAETIARAAMAVGCPPPAVSFGMGRGIRDRLGLLRIAINPEKEIIEAVVGQFDAPRVFDAMVSAGRLDAPGMGFIYTRPILKGVFRADAAPLGSTSGVSLEQIIRAIDELKGSQDWRAARTSLSADTQHGRGHLLDLVNIMAVVRQGLGDDCVLRAMEAGASGVTTTIGTRLGVQDEHDAAGHWVTREVEVLDLTVASAQSQGVMDAICQMPELVEPGAAQIVAMPVPRALTYLGKSGLTRE